MGAFYDLDGNQTTSQTSYEVTGSYAVTYPTYSAGSFQYADLSDNPQSATELAIGSNSSTSVGWTYTSYETYYIPLSNETLNLQPISHFGMFTEMPANFSGHISDLSTATSWEQGFVTFENVSTDYGYVIGFAVATIWDTEFGLNNSLWTTVLTNYTAPETIYLTEAITIYSGLADDLSITEYPNSFSGDWRNDDLYLLAAVRSLETYIITLTTGSTTTLGSSETQLFGYYKLLGDSEQSTGYIYTGGVDRSYAFRYDETYPFEERAVIPKKVALVIYEDGIATTKTTVTHGVFLDKSIFGAFSFGVSDSTNNYVEIAKYGPSVMGIVPNNYFQAVYEQGFYSGYSYDLGAYSASEESMGLFFHTTTSSNDMVESIISLTTFKNSYFLEPVTYTSTGITDQIAIAGTLPVTLAGLWGFTSYDSTGSSTAFSHFYTMTGNSSYTTASSAVTIGKEGVNVVASPHGLIAEVLGHSGYFKYP